MAAFITRLDLVSGKKVQIGEFWPGEETMQAYKVGLIVERGEVAMPNDEDGSVETVAGYYEVWLFPDELRNVLFDFFGKAYAGGQLPTPTGLAEALSQVPNVPCREVKESRVEFSEKIWPMPEAWPLIQSFFEEQLGVQEESAPTPPKAQPNGPQQQAP